MLISVERMFISRVRGPLMRTSIWLGTSLATISPEGMFFSTRGTA